MQLFREILFKKILNYCFSVLYKLYFNNITVGTTKIQKIINGISDSLILLRVVKNIIKKWEEHLNIERRVS